MSWLKKFWILFDSRNKEFYRDRAALAWNFAFPFLVVLGFGVMFTGDNQALLKVGVFNPENVTTTESFFTTPSVQFVPLSTIDDGLFKLKHHAYDLVVQVQQPKNQYWINQSSPKGKLLERMVPATWTQSKVDGKEIRYVDWLISGLLGMNMMFSALFGVGYVMVRYRKTGVLKRLKASPLAAWEFLLAQVLSRLVLITGVSTIVFVGSHMVVKFQVLGSYWNLALVLTMGAMCLISLGLLLAARVKSEEFAGGVLNLISWPMMFLSGVWFSLEGSPVWVQKLAYVFPLTPIIHAARAVMTEGATLAQIMPDVTLIGAMTFVFITAGALLFKWD